MDQLHQFLNGFEKFPFRPFQLPIKRTTNQSQIPNKSKEKWKILHFDNNPSCSFESLQSKHLILLLLQLIFFTFMPISHQSWDGIIVTQADYQALQAFKHELIDPKGALRSWNDTGIGACSGKWFGIKCVRGQVISIQLPWKGLGGRITEKVGQFAALRKLSLHDNFIEGQVPWSLGFLPTLKGVSLFNNRLSGSIPPSICYCPLLQTLDLSNNSLTGNIPENLSNSTHLYRLNLSFNGLSGSIPMGLARSASLTYLSLQHNNLSGLIPDTWGGGTKEEQNLYQLRSLVLDHNLINGKIPVSLNRLKRLEEISLSSNRINGSIPEDMGTLSQLQTLDLSNNDIGGRFPASLSNLSLLVLLNLEGNRLESQIPESVDKLKRLSVLKLRRNRFMGQIPATLGNITSLSQLDLSDNNFTGDIPPSLAYIPNLVSFNVSYNNLSGPVPLRLSEKFNSSSFVGNRLLCGYSGSSPCPIQNLPPPSTSRKRRGPKLSTKDIILITLAVLLAVLAPVVCILLYFVLRKRRASSDRKSVPPSGAAGAREKGVAGAGTEVESGGEAGGKLVHFDGPLVFTADDLLCATAEIMGKSTYGTVYKATLEDGSQVAVKRLREKIAKNQREFESEVNVLGKIRHHNLLALRAYYLGPKGEKLLVFDYMPKGNLSTFLHAREPDTTVDWATRMKIVMGVTRGLFHLHNHENIIHGNLTSGNILLHQNTDPKISDFGLSRLMTTAANSNVIATAGALGYRAPELSKLKKANTKTDVYSLGVIILELLTGKSPSKAFNGADLPQWVASIVKEEWTNEVFDLELMRDTSTTTGDELLNTLKLALHCVDPSPAARPETQQILQQLEQIMPDLAAGSDDDGAGTSTAIE